MQNNSNYQIMKKLSVAFMLVLATSVTSCKDKDVEEATDTTDTTVVVTPEVDTVQTTTTVEVDTLSTE